MWVSRRPDYVGSVVLAAYYCCGAAKIKGGKYALQPRDSGDARHGLIRNFKGRGPKTPASDVSITWKMTWTKE